MLYIGVDLHRKQMTVCLRDEFGSVVLQRQVSTRPQKVDEFLGELAARQDGYMVLLEVCGFHDWLVKRLRAESACRSVLVVQPETRSKNKTDRRDSHRLSELLWVNRERIAAGQKVQGLRVVYVPTDAEQQDRQLTASRERLGRKRTKTINQVHHILRRHNLEWEVPTKTFQTRQVRSWLKQLPLGDTDRLDMNHLLEQWELYDRQVGELEQRLKARYLGNATAQLLGTIVGVSSYMALALLSRIGDITRFASPRSLANFFGLVPGSRSSGETERRGSITKQGSRLVRFLLGQLTLHVLRRDARMRGWFKRIKQRRGAKIARVAVMRRLTVILWHMLTKQQAYQYGGEPAQPRQEAAAVEAEATRRERLAEFQAAARGGAVRSSTGSSSLCST